jgi:hypothetical protein
MEVVLQAQLFVDDEYTVAYGNRKATFTIIDEELPGNHRLGRINRINCLVQEFDEMGVETGAHLGMPVIGMGDMVVGVMTENPALRGSLLNRDNMAECVVMLYDPV